MAKGTVRGVALFALVALVAAAACQPQTAANVDFSCPTDCQQRTGYGDRCSDLTQQPGWCRDLFSSRAAGYRGNASGAQRLPCGCWSFGPTLTGWKDPTCASSNARIEACIMGCMGGVIATSVVCS